MPSAGKPTPARLEDVELADGASHGVRFRTGQLPSTCCNHQMIEDASSMSSGIRYQRAEGDAANLPDLDVPGPGHARPDPQPPGKDRPGLVQVRTRLATNAPTGHDPWAVAAVSRSPED